MYGFFLACILLSPLPFGSNRPWAWNLCALMFSLIGLKYFVQVLLGKRQLVNFSSVSVSIFLFCIPMAWAIVQAYNPPVASWAHPFWKLAAEQLNTPIQAHISVDPEETWTALMRLLSYGIVFFLSLQFNRNSDNAALTFKALAYTGFVYALYGIIEHLGNFNMILWFEKWSYQQSLTSTFVNRNSYATYAGLTLVTSIPLLFNSMQPSLKYGLSSNYGRQYFYEHLLIRGWFPLILTFTIITALLLSQSRGGFLSTAFAIISLVIVLLVSGKINRKNRLFSIVSLLTIVFWIVFSKGFDILMLRFDALDIESKGRELVYDLVAKASYENSWLGLGYGTFEHSFRLYRDESINAFYDKAHNTYLENLFELGWLQASALFLSIIWLALICLRGVWLRQRNWLYPALGFAASVLVGTHAFVDFSLQIPAIAYTYALILGAGVAQSFPSRRE